MSLTTIASRSEASPDSTKRNRSSLCDSPSGSSGRIFIVVLAITLGFAAFTRHAWEDFYITYRASENLATGRGLVYTEGERLHTFTSPLGTVIPAGLRRIMGEVPPETVLWGFRLISSAFFAAGVAVLVRACIQFGLRTLPTLLTAGLIAFDAKSIDFSINGMETGLLLFALAACVWSLTGDRLRPWIMIGSTWAALLWCRPDSFVYFGALACGWLLFNPQPASLSTRRDWFKVFLKAGLLCAVLYLPWILVTAWYYGTPVPHTVTAKGLSVDRQIADLASQFALFPFKIFTPGSPFRLLFAPAYVDMGGWFLIVRLFSYGLGAISAVIWLWPRSSRLTRTFSFATFCGGFYLDAVCPYPAPWYVPMTGLLAALTLGSMCNDLLQTGRCKRPGSASFRLRIAPLLPAGVLTAVLIQMAVTISVAAQLRHQQALVETGNRREVGAWLKANATSADDTVFLECLGYIGYFSGLKMLDHPGLSSLEMVKARRQLQTDDWNLLVRYLNPDWLVLRPKEVPRLGGETGAMLSQDYELVRRFDVGDRIAQLGWLPGRQYLESDQTYLVYRRAITRQR